MPLAGTLSESQINESRTALAISRAESKRARGPRGRHDTATARHPYRRRGGCGVRPSVGSPPPAYKLQPPQAMLAHPRSIGPCHAPAGRSGPWSQRTGPPEASAPRRDRTPDAHGVAHETIREHARQGSKRRETKTTKRLITQATENLRLRDEMALGRAEGLVSGLPRTPSGLANDAVVAGDGPHPPDELGAVDREVQASSFSPAVPPACHKERSPDSLGQPQVARSLTAPRCLVGS
jgi:hypothetical protein